jgi:hypothetical protein
VARKDDRVPFHIWDDTRSIEPLRRAKASSSGESRSAYRRGLWECKVSESKESVADDGNAIRAAGGKRVKLVTYDDDHPFSSHRLALGDALFRWLNNDCLATQEMVAKQ